MVPETSDLPRKGHRLGAREKGKAWMCPSQRPAARPQQRTRRDSEAERVHCSFRERALANCSSEDQLIRSSGLRQGRARARWRAGLLCVQAWWHCAWSGSGSVEEGTPAQSEGKMRSGAQKLGAGCSRAFQETCLREDRPLRIIHEAVMCEPVNTATRKGDAHGCLKTDSGQPKRSGSQPLAV